MVYQLVDRGNVIGQTVVSGEDRQSVSYVRGLGYISRHAGTHTSYYFDNGQGDVVQTRDAAGNVENQYEYDIFGEATLCVEEYENPFRYRGEQYDSETGNIYLRARYYNPTQGRFLTQDSFAGMQSQPNTLNLYAYCGNDPVNNIDPSGHLFEGPGWEAYVEANWNNEDSFYYDMMQEIKHIESTSETYYNGLNSDKSNAIWNNYGEIIGYNPNGPGYTDRSQAAENIHGGGEQANQEIYAIDASNKKKRSEMYSGKTGWATLVFSDEVDMYRNVGWYASDDRVELYSTYDLSKSEAYGYEIRAKLNGDETGTWYTEYIDVEIYDSTTGSNMKMPAWQAYGYVQDGSAYTAFQTVPLYDSVTGIESFAFGYEIKQKRAGDSTGRWYTANERVPLFDSVTGIESEAYAWEIYGKRMGDDTGKWYTANEIVPLYDSVTGNISYAEAWEVYGKRIGDDTGKWYTANESVLLYDSVTGVESSAEAWEVYGKRIGDNTGTWYTANESVALYDDYGYKSSALASEIASKRAGDSTGTWHTGSESVTVYEYGSGHQSFTNYAELSDKRAGDSTGRWAIGSESIPVYSQVQGKTVYVQASSAETYLQNDAIMFAKRNKGEKANGKPGFVPRKDKRHGSEERQPSGDRERNVGHPDGEEHSRVPKGNRGNVSRVVTESTNGVIILSGILWWLISQGYYVPA